MINHPYTREKHERLREAVKKFQEVSRPWNRPLASGLSYLGTIPPAVISVFFFRKLLEKANLISGFFFGLISVALFNFISTLLISSVIFIPRMRGRKYFREALEIFPELDGRMAYARLLVKRCSEIRKKFRHDEEGMFLFYKCIYEEVMTEKVREEISAIRLRLRMRHELENLVILLKSLSRIPAIVFRNLKRASIELKRRKRIKKIEEQEQEKLERSLKLEQMNRYLEENSLPQRLDFRKENENVH